MSSVTFTAAMERALQSLYTEMGTDMLTRVSEHFKLDKDDVIRVSGLTDITVKKAEKKTVKKVSAPKPAKKEKPCVPLPFVGKIDENSCLGIKFNHQLHTQCTNTRVGSSDYCKTCGKQAEANATHKPNYGDIRERLECGLLEFKDYKGIQTLPYINVINKMKLDTDKAMAEAAKFGVNIPEEHMVAREITRGRKKKTDSDSDASSTTSSVKKGPGRPKTVKPVVVDAESDLLSQLKAAKKEDVSKGETDNESTSSGSSSKGSKLTPEEKALRKAQREAKKLEREAIKQAEKEQRKAQREAEKLERQAIKQAERDAIKKAKEEASKKIKEAAKKAKEEAAMKAKEAKEQAKTSTKAKSVTVSEPKSDDSAVVNEPETETEMYAGCAAGIEAAKAEALKKNTEKSNTEKSHSIEVNDDDSVESENDSVELEEEEAEDELDVEEFDLDGKTYLKTSDNVLFDNDTHEPVGIFNPDTNKIESIDGVEDGDE